MYPKLLLHKRDLKYIKLEKTKRWQKDYLDIHFSSLHLAMYSDLGNSFDLVAPNWENFQQPGLQITAFIVNPCCA